MGDRIRDAATSIGVMTGAITGAATIVGWIVSTESPAVVAGTAVGYVGMIYCGGFALGAFVVAILPNGTLKRLEAERLAKARFTARAFYFGAGCVFAAIFIEVGNDPLDGTWIGIGAVALIIAGSVAVSLYPDMAARRRDRSRVCPDYAETIKSTAHVCRYCGYRFAVSPPLHLVVAEESQPGAVPAGAPPTTDPA